MYNCEYCKSQFKTKSNLKHHQWTAKYCLKLQNVINDEFTCEYCQKIFSTKYCLNTHDKICKAKFSSDSQKKPSIEEVTFLRQQLEQERLERERERSEKEKLQKTIEKLASEAIAKPTTVQNTKNSKNNTIFNKCILTLELPNSTKIIDEKLDINTVFSGQKGLAQFTFSNILVDDKGNLTYKCTDPSRKIFNHRDINGKITKDIQAVKLLNTIHQPLSKKSHTLLREKMDDENESMVPVFLKQGEKINDFESDPSKFVSHLVSLTT